MPKLDKPKGSKRVREIVARIEQEALMSSRDEQRQTDRLSRRNKKAAKELTVIAQKLKTVRARNRREARAWKIREAETARALQANRKAIAALTRELKMDSAARVRSDVATLARLCVSIALISK